VQSFITQPLRPPLIRRKSNAAGIMKKMSGGNVINDNTNEMMELNPLVSSIKISATVEIFSLVKQMEAEGIEVTSLCVGEPDFPPPKSVLDAAIKAIESNETRYTAVSGTMALREAIANDLQNRKGVTYDAQTEILVSNGAKQCVYQGVLATCGTGDTAIIVAPYWPSYPEMVALSGANAIILRTQRDNGYLISPHALRSCLEENKEKNVKLLILCNPSNPTGGVHSKQRLEEIADVLEDFPGVTVLSDEIYERLVYGDKLDNGHFSFAALSPSMRARTITINGFSKAYAMTGMRLGYMAAPPKLLRAATTIQSQLTSCAGSISQSAGVAALEAVSESEMEANLLIMKEKRDFVVQKLKAMHKVKLAVPPTGAFYVLPDVSTYYDGDDVKLCVELLKKKRLALVPGTSFGAPGTVRISYATSMQELEVAMDKLRSFLDDLV